MFAELSHVVSLFTHVIRFKQRKKCFIFCVLFVCSVLLNSVLFHPVPTFTIFICHVYCMYHIQH
jgi:hypothetical protein